MWIYPKTRAVFKVHSEIRSYFKDYTFPAVITDSELGLIGLEPIHPTPKPVYDINKTIIERPPVLGEGGWVQVWAEENASSEEVEKRKSALVPRSVSKRQGRQQLIIMGIIGQVQPAIDAITDDLQRSLVQSFWDDSSQYERDHPQMIQLATVIGLTSEEMDAAFIAAEQLD